MYQNAPITKFFITSILLNCWVFIQVRHCFALLPYQPHACADAARSKQMMSFSTDRRLGGGSIGRDWG